MGMEGLALVGKEAYTQDWIGFGSGFLFDHILGTTDWIG
jgi:hypothetical protein